MWSLDRLVFLTRETGGLRAAASGARRNVRLYLPSTHVPLFHAWKP
jgi:hypothetical protein